MPCNSIPDSPRRAFQAAGRSARAVDGPNKKARWFPTGPF